MGILAESQITLEVVEDGAGAEVYTHIVFSEDEGGTISETGEWKGTLVSTDEEKPDEASLYDWEYTGAPEDINTLSESTDDRFDTATDDIESANAAIESLSDKVQTTEDSVTVSSDSYGVSMSDDGMKFQEAGSTVAEIHDDMFTARNISSTYMWIGDFVLEEKSTGELVLKKGR